MKTISIKAMLKRVDRIAKSLALWGALIFMIGGFIYGLTGDYEKGTWYLAITIVMTLARHDAEDL